MTNYTRKKGFTLAEILIAALIIGILVVVLAPVLVGAPSKSRDTKRINDIESLATALKEEQLGGLEYPNSSYCILRGYGMIDRDEYRSYFAEGLIPLDPKGDDYVGLTVGTLTCDVGGAYTYVVDPGNSGSYSFGIYGRLENAQNANTACSTLIAAPDVKSPVVAGSNDYCYVVFIL